MNLFKKIALSILVGASLHSCSCSDQQEQVSEEEAVFVGTWETESENEDEDVEILGFAFLPQKESLTLNEANNCLEMNYDTAS